MAKIDVPTSACLCTECGATFHINVPMDRPIAPFLNDLREKEEHRCSKCVIANRVRKYGSTL